MRIISVICFGISCGVFPVMMSCSSSPPETPQEEVKVDKLVARVASVNAAEKYALIQRYGKLNVEDNELLYTMGMEGKTASLKVTGERLGQHIAVDIVSGELSIGDAVFLRSLEKEEKVDDKSNSKGKEY